MPKELRYFYIACHRLCKGLNHSGDCCDMALYIGLHTVAYSVRLSFPATSSGQIQRVQPGVRLRANIQINAQLPKLCKKCTKQGCRICVTHRPPGNFPSTLHFVAAPAAPEPVRSCLRNLLQSQHSFRVYWLTAQGSVVSVQQTLVPDSELHLLPSFKFLRLSR